MEEPTPIPILETGEPRHCPACGSRVADLATECLMCGASLDVEEEPPPEEPPPPRFQVPWRGIIVSIITVAAFIAGVGWLVRMQIIGQAGTPTPAFTATVTRTPTRAPTSTSTPTITPSPTPIPPRVHQVQQGDSCFSVAAAYGISLEPLATLNPDKCPDGIIRPGDLLLIPAATSIPGPTPTTGPGTPSPTPQCPILHVVQTGDTGIGIAERYNISLGTLVAANPDKNIDQLQVNQVLQIPCGTPTPTPSPTPDPNATPTPIPKYAAPDLLSPADGATLAEPMVALQWTAVSLLRESEFYAVRLRRLDETAPVQSRYVRATLLRLDEEFAPSPDDPLREYSWEVTVVRRAGTSATGETRYTAASYPSEMRTFRWLVSTPEATSRATLAP